MVLVLRSELLRILDEDLRVSSVKTFLQERFPIEWYAAGDQVSAMIENSIRRATAYGLLAYQDVLRYCVLTLVIGEHFEKSKDYSWAGEILTDVDSPLAGKRASRVYNTAVRQLRETERSL